jgi:hypothetical protein
MRVPASIVAAVFVTLILLGLPAGSQTVVPVGVQGQVNTYTINDQFLPVVGFDGNGNFVVVWQSYGSAGTDKTDLSIQGRVFDSNGVPALLDTQVNTYATGDQRAPEVGVDDAGNFVVVWSSDGSPGDDDSYQSIQGQRYGSNGQPFGDQFQINTYTRGDQRRPAVGMSPEGAFVVVWQSYGPFDTSNWDHDIQGQRYDSDGFPVGGEFQVNSATTFSHYQYDPAVGMNAEGAFVVVWKSMGSYGSDDSATSIQGRIFNSAGLPAGLDSQVNTYTTLFQRSPEVDVGGDGSFAVVWDSYGSDGTDSGSSYSIQGRIYNSIGVAIGPETQVNTYTTGDQVAPDVAADGEGNFIVVWRSEGSSGTDDSESSIQGRRYASDGALAGPEFQVNTYTPSFQGAPAVEIDSRGRGVVVWASLGSSGSDLMGYSIQGQRFALPHIFSDGFESGDTTIWSSTVP